MNYLGMNAVFRLTKTAGRLRENFILLPPYPNRRLKPVWFPIDIYIINFIIIIRLK